jgi:hypothetical protein
MRTIPTSSTLTLALDISYPLQKKQIERPETAPAYSIAATKCSFEKAPAKDAIKVLGTVVITL